VPGGGQNDIWHPLTCKGKYAGEIRIEITYYDTRPKQEKPREVRQSATSGGDEGSRDSLKGPRQPKAPVKRRPLPSDPVTGAPPPAAIPDHVQTPPRGYPSPQAAIPDHVQTPPRGYQSPQAALPEHIHMPSRGYQSPQTAIPEHVQTPSRGHNTPSYISNQSPLQSVEYSTSPQQFSRSQGYGTSPHMNGYNGVLSLRHQLPSQLQTKDTKSTILEMEASIRTAMRETTMEKRKSTPVIRTIIDRCLTKFLRPRNSGLLLALMGHLHLLQHIGAEMAVNM